MALALEPAGLRSLRNPLDCPSESLLAISKARGVGYQKRPQTKIDLSPPLQLLNPPEQPQMHIPSAPVRISPFRTSRDAEEGEVCSLIQFSSTSSYREHKHQFKGQSDSTRSLSR